MVAVFQAQVGFTVEHGGVACVQCFAIHHHATAGHVQIVFVVSRQVALQAFGAVKQAHPQ